MKKKEITGVNKTPVNNPLFERYFITFNPAVGRHSAQ
jgi:hypothetical protein